MKIVNSSKRFSTIIAGILLISVLTIFVAVLIGFGGNSLFKQDGFQLVYTEIPSNPESSNLFNGKNKNVPIAKVDYLGEFDTPAGIIDYTITVNNINIDDITELPLCLQDTVDMDLVGIDTDGDGVDDLFDLELAGWLITAEVTGGYHELQSYLKIKQEKDGVVLYEKVYIEWNDGVKLYEFPGDCRTLYTGVFDVDDLLDEEDDLGVAIDGSGIILLDANHAPPNAHYPPNVNNLDKFVDVWFKSQWAGCGQDPQQFWLILVQ